MKIRSNLEDSPVLLISICTSLLKRSSSGQLGNQNYFTGDLDAFEQFIQDRLGELNDRRAGEERFPVEGPGGEPNYRYVDHRDCILEGETR